MPDGVADQLANRQDFLDLIRFLVERKTPSTGTPLWRSKLFWSKKSPPVKVAYQSWPSRGLMGFAIRIIQTSFTSS